MPHETRAAPEELHADPQVLVAATIEIFLTLRKRLTQFLTIPVGAQGGFLQPPSASPSGEA